MKFTTTTALALVAATAAIPAAAQNYGAQNEQRQRAAAEQTQQQPQTAPGQNAQVVKPSGKALKAIVDLQAAVNKNDTANIPAKVAAAQAVATTKEDRYLIAQLQLKAALASKDNAATAAAIDAVAASGYLDAAKTAELY
ncbi:MAG: hypothetical protein ACJ8EH_07520, partial [Sphingomicrobium sp.]